MYKRQGSRTVLNRPKTIKIEAKREHYEERARTGPSKSTRGELAKKEKEDKKTVGCLNQPSESESTMPIILSEGDEQLTAYGRTDDGADFTLISPRIAEKAVISGIGRMKKIRPMKLQVALKDKQEAQAFTFSRSWTAPRTVLQLPTGPLALLNITYLVADDDLAEGDLLIGLPVLKVLGLDTKKLLEQRRNDLHGTECSQATQF